MIEPMEQVDNFQLSSGCFSVIDGFVGQVHPDQVLGWAFDRERPDEHVTVDIYCGDRYLGSTAANIFRADLAVGRIGTGDHGFLFHFPGTLEERELAAVEARVRTLSDPTVGSTLPSFFLKRAFQLRAMPLLPYPSLRITMTPSFRYSCWERLAPARARSLKR